MGAQVASTILIGDPARTYRGDEGEAARFLTAAIGAVFLHVGLLGVIALDEWPHETAGTQEQVFTVELAPDEATPVVSREEPSEGLEAQPVRRSGGDPDLAPGASEPMAAPDSSQAAASEPEPPVEAMDEPASPQLAAAAPLPARKPLTRQNAAVPPIDRATPNAPEGQGGGDRYLNLIRDRILSKRDYPAVANPLQLSGVAFFELVLDRAGSLLSLRLVRTSGVGTLDDVGTDMIRRAAPFPPVPDHIAGECLRLSLTLALGPS